MNVCEHLVATAKLFPDKDAIVFEETHLTFRQLDALSIQAAEILQQAGVTCGDRVAILLPNVPAFPIWYYAALRSGAVAVSLSTRLTESEVAALVADCDAKALVRIENQKHTVEATTSGLPPVLRVSELGGDLCDGNPLEAASAESSHYVDCDPNDAALILYTSGTTGFAKGATLSHSNVRSNVNAFNHLCGMQTADQILLAVPLFHCFGQNALLNSALNVGATIVLQRKFDLHEAKRLIAEHRVTQLYGVPTMFQLLHDSCQQTELASVRYCFSAAATLPIQVSRRWLDKFGLPIHEGYGLTETSPFASYNHRQRYLMGSIGTPIDCVEMRIVDTETGDRCPPGELGEIAIRGPNVMLGYWNRPHDTAACIRNGWFYSGDIGRVDEQGFFFIVDRVKDMISVGGLKVYPAEVERVLLDIEGVNEAAVVGMPDEVLGEQVAAFVVLSPRTEDSEEQLRAEITRQGRERLARYKLPRWVVFVDQLPRNPSGKILKTELREFDLKAHPADTMFQQGEARQPSAATDWAAEPGLVKTLETVYATERIRVATESLQRAVQSLTDSEELPEADARFLDAGMDSLMIVELSAWLQRELGTEQELPATLVFDYPTIGELARLIVSLASPGEAAAATNASASQRIGRGIAKPAATQSPSESGREVADMSEDEALGELMREIEAE